MANKKYEETDIQAIADAIRDKTGTEDTYKVSDMADGVNDVYDKGRNDGMCDFWNIVTNNRSRESYERAFSYWGAEYIRPPYKITPLIGKTMFAQANIKKVEKKYFDLSQTTPSQTNANSGNYSIFNACPNLEEIEDIGIPAGYYYYTFFKSSKLQTIEVLRFVETTNIDGGFNQCYALRNITIEGVIGQNISFSDSPLTVESMKSIITHLKNYAGTTSEKAYTLTLKSSCVTELETAEFTASDMDELYKKGINVTDDMTWVDVIDDLKWNLVTA